MKNASVMILISALSLLNAGTGLICYWCADCGTVGSSTPTQSCEDEPILPSAPSYKCFTLNFYNDAAKGVTRGCVPDYGLFNDDCVRISTADQGTDTCYCSTDRCNNQNFNTLPTASPPTSPPIELRIQCYHCTDCPTTNSSTPTRFCRGTQGRPPKCETVEYYGEPQKRTSRSCVSNSVQTRCLDNTFSKIKSCYCDSDLCNGGQPGIHGDVRGNFPIGSLVSLLLLTLLMK